VSTAARRSRAGERETSMKFLPDLIMSGGMTVAFLE
jgi:hypothetical protein